MDDDDKPAEPEESAQTGDSEAAAESEPERAGSSASWIGSRSRLIALLGGLLFLAGVVYAAVNAFAGSRVGAESAEAAVAELVEALNNEDMVGALSVMAPSEVGTLSDVYPDMVKMLAQNGTLESEDWLAGSDFELVGLETVERELYPGVALVELHGGTLSMTIDPELADPVVSDIWGDESEVTIEELREQLRELDESLEVEDMQETINDTASLLVADPFTITSPANGIFLMTVERDGRWYVSPFYTIAEYARQLLDLPPADYSLSREDAAPGAPNPSGVLDDVIEVVNSYTLEEHLEALLDGDPDMMFAPFSAFSPSDEFGVFIDYAPSYAALTDSLTESAEGELAEDQLNEELRELLDYYELEGQISVTLDVSEEQRLDGDVILSLKSGSIRADLSFLDEGGFLDEVDFLDEGDIRQLNEIEFEFSWDGLCGQAYLLVNGEPEALGEAGVYCPFDDVAPEGLDEAFVVVGEVGGTWYISYVETILAYLDLFIAEQIEG